MAVNVPLPSSMKGNTMDSLAAVIIAIILCFLFLVAIGVLH